MAELGTHPVRDLPRPERVVQLCHPDVRNEFPPLRTAKAARSHNLPAQLTSFVGRAGQIDDVSALLRDNRLVTLTGAGGAGKTRLAIETAGQLAEDFDDGVRWIDLAPVAEPSRRAGDDRPHPRASRPTGPLPDGHRAAVHQRPENASAA